MIDCGWPKFSFKLKALEVYGLLVLPRISATAIALAADLPWALFLGLLPKLTSVLVGAVLSLGLSYNMLTQSKEISPAMLE